MKAKAKYLDKEIEFEGTVVDGKTIIPHSVLQELAYTAKDELSELRTAEKNLAEILGQARNEPGRAENRKKNDELE